ncbi:MAG: 50S ribosomal protein L10 [Anaerolineaceae bacterium]|nr:50S ribosomal protein L10 [Anaerolineaceae bacterium]MCY3908383.1 50S ribosomal protein L10 [Anaerolineaceae bacterium]
MAISRQQKEALVAAYGRLLGDTGGFILTGYSGLSVADLHDLRLRLRANNASYVITRNRLFKLALQENDWPVPEEMLQGPVATAFADGDMPGMAKTLLDFQRDHEEVFVIKGGIMDGDVLGPAEVEALSRLPTLDELRASLAGLVMQPAAGIVNTLNAATVDIVNVLQAYVQDNSEEGEAAA